MALDTRTMTRDRSQMTCDAWWGYIKFFLVTKCNIQTHYLLTYLFSSYWKTKGIAFFFGKKKFKNIFLLKKKLFFEILYFSNVLDWRALVKLGPPNIGKLRG